MLYLIPRDDHELIDHTLTDLTLTNSSIPYLDNSTKTTILGSSEMTPWV